MSDFWDKLRKIVKANPKGRAYDERGQFYPDPTPVAPPVGFTDDVDMFERVRQMVRREMSAAAQAEGFESFDEADDFDVGDDYEPFSPYEMIMEQAQPDGPVVNPDPTQTVTPGGSKSQPAGESNPPSDGPAVPPAEKAGRPAP